MYNNSFLFIEQIPDSRFEEIGIFGHDAACYYDDYTGKLVIAGTLSGQIYEDKLYKLLLVAYDKDGDVLVTQEGEYVSRSNMFDGFPFSFQISNSYESELHSYKVSPTFVRSQESPYLGDNPGIWYNDCPAMSLLSLEVNEKIPKDRVQTDFDDYALPFRSFSCLVRKRLETTHNVLFEVSGEFVTGFSRYFNLNVLAYDDECEMVAHQRFILRPTANEPNVFKFTYAVPKDIDFNTIVFRPVRMGK